MASGKSSPGKSSGKSSTRTSTSRTSSGAKAAGSSSSRPEGKSATKVSTSKVNTSRPAGRGPAQRPPARRKSTSIVNQKQTPWGLIATIAAVVVFAAAVIAVVVVQRSGSSNQAAGGGSQIIPSTPTGSVTTEKSVKQVANTTGISGVRAYDTAGYPAAGKAGTGTLEHQHVDGPVSYSVTPPVGGPHNATWMNAGVYTKPVPNERAVHNLEHGAVWITYRPNLSKADVATLTAFVGKQSLIDESAGSGVSGQESRYMDLSPWASNSLPAPIVISSWGYQLYVQSPTDPRLQAFVDKFRHNSTYSPEYGSAVDGIPVQTGGRPSAFGATKANPAGSA